MLALCSIGSLADECRAQQTIPPAPPPIQTTTELVKVDLSVLDKHGNFVSGLEKKDFRVLDDGNEKPLVFFTPVEAPAQVLVMVEASPAVYLIHNQHLLAAYALLDGLAPDDQVALAVYNQAPRAILAFTSDKRALAAALGQIQYTIGMGQLNFYDSISIVLDWLAPLAGKKAIVLLTTGLDSSPPTQWDALVRKLQIEDDVIFPVALGGSLRHFKEKKKKSSETTLHPDGRGNASSLEVGENLSFAKADGALLSLATITGGRAYFPESAKDFLPIYREIAAALRHLYVLGIAPEHDGQFHSLTVQILDHKGQPIATVAKNAEFRVFAREGYRAPGP